MEEEFTELLLAWGQGDQTAFARLAPMVYDELRRLAHHYLREERVGHTMQTTDLVNEVCLRLVKIKRVDVADENKFRALAARLMRNVLVDHARTLALPKHGNGARKIPLEEMLLLTPETSWEMLALDEALSKLARTNPQASHIVELKFFGGFKGKEIAEVLQVSEATVSTEGEKARLWLMREVRGELRI